jgi:hypothetical protein
MKVLFAATLLALLTAGCGVESIAAPTSPSSTAIVAPVPICWPDLQVGSPRVILCP